MKIVDDPELGPYDKAFTLPGCSVRTVYWRVVSRTMADMARNQRHVVLLYGGHAPTNTPPSVLDQSRQRRQFYRPGERHDDGKGDDPDGAVTRVDFFAGSTLVGSVTSAPFTFTWSPAPAGSYSLTAQAVDDLGDVTTSPELRSASRRAPAAICRRPGPTVTSAPWRRPATQRSTRRPGGYRLRARMFGTPPTSSPTLISC